MIPIDCEGPSLQSIAETLGGAVDVWDAIIDALGAEYGGLASEWKESKAFGWTRVLKRKKRTLVYLTPTDGTVRVAVVLGEKAAKRALDSELPDGIKQLIQEARPYAEGRGIAFHVCSVAELPIVTDLVAIKMAP